MDPVPGNDRRRDFSAWLRTGRHPTRTADGIELKFNPYHDPRNGQFTFAPGGPRSLERVVISHRRPTAASRRPPEGVRRKAAAGQEADVSEGGRLLAAVYRPDGNAGSLRNVQFVRPPRIVRGSNSRAFDDPLTLEQTFPGLRAAPGGAIISLLDNVFDITGPANELMAAMTKERSALLISQITALDPNWTFQSLGFPTTWEGQRNQINDLRMQRAAAFVRVRGELRPMQVETMRVMQDAADRAYNEAVKLSKRGMLNERLSRQEAIGNYVDRLVRRQLNESYKRLQISKHQQIRVNQREYDTSKAESSFRRPDARVGQVAYDVTLTRKTMRDRQIQGFFDADFKPEQVVIIRPRQIGRGSSYIINQAEHQK